MYRCRGPRIDDSPQRKGCGERLDKLIAAVKPDGEVHKVKCPKCTTEATVRKVPLEELEAE